MNAETENLSPQESLDVITSMIRQAKGNVQRSSFYFLLWGWTITLANLGVFFMLKFTSITNPFMIFSITIPAAVVSVIHGIREDKRLIAPTLLDNIHQWLWTGFGITCFIFAIFGQRIGWQINPVIITMCAAPTFVSGVMLRFKPLMFGGVAFWIFGTVSFLVPIDIQFLLAAVAVIVGYLVPGYMLRKSEV